MTKKGGLTIPHNYKPVLSIKDTQVAIKQLKDFFENKLAEKLKLTRVSAPLFVRPESGMNDNLSGVERTVTFNVKGIDDAPVEIVQSLAKWKRVALERYSFLPGEGLYTDMNAIRRDEDLDNLHSVYVDQWDWECVIKKSDRTEEKLIQIVKDIFDVFKSTEAYICDIYPQLSKMLPNDIFFITAQQLEDMFPELTPKEREHRIAQEKKAVFIMKIGGMLKSGIRHDGRAPDYDDWEMNGDIVFWYSPLETAFEVSSMGIRVDEDTLLYQLKEIGCEERMNLQYHKNLIEGRLPYTVGGGIGQSRICMFFLGKAHIGEVQASVWPEEMIKDCEASNIMLL